MSKSNQHIQKATYIFRLTTEQVRTIANAFYTDEHGKYTNQVYLRFCVLNTTDEQDDSFPSDLTINVNSMPYCLPIFIDVDTSTGIILEQRAVPLNITHLLKLNPMKDNNVTVFWTHDVLQDYVISIELGKAKLPAIEFENRL